MTAGLGWAIALAALVAIGVAVAFVNRFYRKASGDLALIRTGAGGRKVVINGGCMVLPFVHALQTVNLHTMRIPVARAGKRSLITSDKLRIDVEMEFFVRVRPDSEGVARTAQTIGARASFSAEDLAGLLEAKFIDAMQAAAAQLTMDQLHERRAEFVAQVASQLQANLASNGLDLDSASLTTMDQTPLAALDENNAFNAVGMRILSEIISANRKERSAIESAADLAVRQTELEAAKRKLEIEREQQEAQIRQQLELEKCKTASEREAEGERQAARLANENRRSETDHAIKAAEIASNKVLRQDEIAALRETEQRKIESQIELAATRGAEVAAQAKLEASRTEVMRAQEALQTERAVAAAEREMSVAAVKARERAQDEQIANEQQFGSLVAREQARLEASKLAALRRNATAEAEAQGKQLVFAAENTQRDALLIHKLELEKLDRLPAIAEAVMKPLEKVKRINVNQVSGLGGGNGSAPGGIGDAANGIVSGILDLAMRLPAAQRVGAAVSTGLGTPADADPADDSAKPAAGPQKQ